MTTKYTRKEALEHLMEACCRTEYCTFDLKKKLSKWGFASKEAIDIVDELKAGGYVDDRRYACAFAHDKFLLALNGAEKIRHLLRLKNVDEDIINDALSCVSEQEQERLLVRLLETKNESLEPDRTLDDRRQRLINFAMGRGFELEKVERFTDELFKKTYNI
jgi:regulatory protein